MNKAKSYELLDGSLILSEGAIIMTNEEAMKVLDEIDLLIYNKEDGGYACTHIELPTEDFNKLLESLNVLRVAKPREVIYCGVIVKEKLDV